MMFSWEIPDQSEMS